MPRVVKTNPITAKQPQYRWEEFYLTSQPPERQTEQLPSTIAADQDHIHVQPVRFPVTLAWRGIYREDDCPLSYLCGRDSAAALLLLLGREGGQGIWADGGVVVAPRAEMHYDGPRWLYWLLDLTTLVIGSCYVTSAAGP